jgi:hypothetical protein
MDTAFPQAPYKIHLPAYAKRRTSTDINAKHTKFMNFERSVYFLQELAKLIFGAKDPGSLPTTNRLQ